MEEGYFKEGEREKEYYLKIYALKPRSKSQKLQFQLKGITT